MKFFNRTERSPGPPLLSIKPRSNLEFFGGKDAKFHYFVDSCEGPALAFDEEEVVRWAASARLRLLGDEVIRKSGD